jgi:uncharacterized membrane protein
MTANRSNPTEEAGRDNPALSKIIERNIRTIIRLRMNASAERKPEDRAADGITSFSGSMAFVYLHLGWFPYGSSSTPATLLFLRSIHSRTAC